MTELYRKSVYITMWKTHIVPSWWYTDLLGIINLEKQKSHWDSRCWWILLNHNPALYAFMGFLCKSPDMYSTVKWWSQLDCEPSSAVNSDVICTSWFPVGFKSSLPSFFDIKQHLQWEEDCQNFTKFCVSLSHVHLSAPPLYPQTASPFICLSSYLDIFFLVITSPAPSPSPPLLSSDRLLQTKC